MKIPTPDGFTDMKDLFGEQYNANMLEWTSFTRNISRFVEKDKKWGKDKNGAYSKFYMHFSPLNWERLSDTVKLKHTVICKRCLNFKMETIFGHFQQKRQILNIIVHKNRI